MEQVSLVWYNYKYRNQIIAIATTSIIVLPLFVFRLPYLAVDDYMMNYIANGSYGSEYNLLYTSPVYAYLLHILYSVMPKLNWYLILLILILILSTNLLISDMVQHGVWFEVAAMLACATIYPFIITFTSVSYIAVGTGVIMIIQRFWEGRSKALVLPITLIIVGYMLRQNTLPSVIALFAPLFVRGCLKSCRANAMILAGVICAVASTCIATFRFSAPLVLAVLVLSAAGCAVSRLYYKESPACAILCISIMSILVLLVNAVGVAMYKVEGWKEFSDWTIARSSVIDYPQRSYFDIRNTLDALRIPESAYRVFWEWCFLDKSVFSTDSLMSIFRATGPHYSIHNISPSTLLSARTWVTLLMPLLIALYLNAMYESEVDKRLYLAACSIDLCGLIVVLLLRDRMAINVSTPLSLLCVLEMLQTRVSHTHGCGYIENDRFDVFAQHTIGRGHYLLSTEKHFRCILVKVGTALAAAISIIVFIVSATSVSHVRKNIESNYSNLVTLIEQSNDKYIVQSSIYNDMYYHWCPMISMTRNDGLKNTIKSGSGDTFSPRYYSQLAQWGYREDSADRLFLELIDSDELSYVGNNSEDIAEYLSDQVGTQVEAIRISVEFCDGVGIYTFKETIADNVDSYSE